MHTSDLFHKQPWSDGPVNLYAQLGVDYYENKYRWVLGGDTSADDGSSGYHDAGLPELTPEAAKAGGYQTAEQAHSFFGNLTGARGTDQEYADLRAQDAAISAGLPTFVNSRGITQNVRDSITVPGDYLGDAIAEFNKNPSIAISPVSLLSLAAKSNPLTAVGTAALSMAARNAGVPDVLTIDREGPKSPMLDMLKEQVTKDDGYNLPEGTTIMPIEYADGGPIVPQGGIGNFYGR